MILRGSPPQSPPAELSLQPTVFSRRDKAAVSVRSRPSQAQSGVSQSQMINKKNRHSGDFGVFSRNPHKRTVSDNWSYVAFVPQDSAADSVHRIVTGTPVKVTNHQMPPVLASRIGPLNNPKANPVEVPISSPAMEAVRRRRSYGQGPHSVKVCNREFQFNRGGRPQSAFFEVAEQQRSLHGNLGPFSLVIPPPPSEPPPVRKEGLGRRSVTQLHIQQNKKNSYTSAICKSQDDLVKAADSEASSEVANIDGISFNPVLTDAASIKKGLLWQQRDKMFSRWKERYFTLSTHYLNCFKRGTSRICEMGDFVFTIKLSEIDEVELLDKRGYLTICILLKRDGKVFLRKTEGIRDWYRAIMELVSIIDRHSTKNNPPLYLSKTPLLTRQNTDSVSMHNWIQNRTKAVLQNQYSDSNPEINRSGNAKAARAPEITLDQLSDLYRNEDFEKSIEDEMRRKSNELMSPRLARQVCAVMNKSGLDNELSQSGGDSELTDLGIEVDKQSSYPPVKKLTTESEASDSGNNSLNTNGSVGSSKSAGSASRIERNKIIRETTVPASPSRLCLHREDSGSQIAQGQVKFRVSSHLMGLQVTHV